MKGNDNLPDALPVGRGYPASYIHLGLLDIYF